MGNIGSHVDLTSGRPGHQAKLAMGRELKLGPFRFAGGKGISRQLSAGLAQDSTGASGDVQLGKTLQHRFLKRVAFPEAHQSAHRSPRFRGIGANGVTTASRRIPLSKNQSRLSCINRLNRCCDVCEDPFVRLTERGLPVTLIRPVIHASAVADLEPFASMAILKRILLRQGDAVRDGRVQSCALGRKKAVDEILNH
jgi:hypothetical protein